MYRGLIIVTVSLLAAVLMSQFHFCYPAAGKAYIEKHKEKRSIRPGSMYYGGTYGSRGFRTGK